MSAVIEENLLYAALRAEAVRMGYPEPKCINCRYLVRIPQMPGQGVCRVRRARGNHPLPVTTGELCLKWEPRYGITRDSPIMRDQPPLRPQELGECDAETEAWLKTLSRTGSLDDW